MQEEGPRAAGERQTTASQMKGCRRKVLGITSFEAHLAREKDFQGPLLQPWTTMRVPHVMSAAGLPVVHPSCVAVLL